MPPLKFPSDFPMLSHHFDDRCRRVRGRFVRAFGQFRGGCARRPRRNHALIFRLVSSQFYVIVDYDSALDARISSFARKWGNWVKIYHL